MTQCKSTISRFVHRLAMFLLVTVCAACVRTPVKPLEWPVDIPPIEHYEQVYERDKHNQAVQTREQYLTWVIRFYQGWKLYQHGWQTTTQDILLSIEGNARKERIESKLDYLGKLISAEWAKNSPDRLIRSRELSIWGQALLNSMDEENEEKLVDLVTRDVDKLLSGDLHPTRIRLSRY